jgi:uncharacterized protein (TIGR02265 family)
LAQQNAVRDEQAGPDEVERAVKDVIGNPNIKGIILLSRRTFVEKTWGKEAWGLTLRRLSADDQEVLGGLIVTAGWYPYALNLRLDRAIATTFAPGDPAKVFLDMGRSSASNNLAGPHASYVKRGQPHDLLAMSPRIYSSYYDKGRRTYEKTGPTSAVLRTFDAENVTHEDCLTVVGWHERAIEICGGRKVKVQETLCRTDGAPHCEYHCQWEI